MLAYRGNLSSFKLQGRARWRDLLHPAVWKDNLGKLRPPAAHRVGHDPIASLAYLFAHAVMAFMIVTGSGLAASAFQAGPLAGWLGNAAWLEDVLKPDSR